MSRAKKKAGLCATAALVLGLAAPSAQAAAPTAAAALPNCTGFKISGGATLPAYRYGPGLHDTHVNCILGRGNTGSAVSTLQVSLIRCNFIRLDDGADGIYGPQTENAVRWVQSVQNIPADGVYGPKTRSVMGWWTGARCVRHW